MLLINNLMYDLFACKLIKLCTGIIGLFLLIVLSHIQEQDKMDAEAEVARKAMRVKAMMNGAGESKKAPPKPRTNTKKANTTASITEPMETSSSAMQTGIDPDIYLC